MSKKVLKDLYRRGKIAEAGLKKAVKDGVISQDDYNEIVGEKK